MVVQDVLVQSDQQGCLGWAGFRLAPVLGIEATYQYADLSREQRDERVADVEAAWLAAQWVPHQPNGVMPRFELRYRNDPAGGPAALRCACLCQVRAATSEAAIEQASRLRDGLAAGLPGHVRAEPLAGAADVHDWLVPFSFLGGPGSQVELVKKFSWQRTMRQDTGRQVTVVVPRFASRRVPWELALRQLAALPFPAVLTVGFEPFPRNPTLRAALEQLAGQYAMLARAAQGSPLYSVSTPPDPFAGYAARCYGEYAQKYDGPAFRVRISLAGQQVLPGQLSALLEGALSGAGVPGADAGGATGAIALLPVEHERTLAWANLATLSAYWLGDTYRRDLPDALLGKIERELLNLVDLEEARSLVQLPVAWPGHTPLYAGLAAAPAQEPDFGWDSASQSRGAGASPGTGEPDSEDPALRYRRDSAEKPPGEQDD